MTKRFLFGGLFSVLLLAALGGFARGMESPEEVVAAYVAALNAKDEAAIRALYHPNSNFRLNPLQQQFFDESFTRELERTPGEDYTSELIELERGVLPMFSIVDWSSNPLMRMTVVYTEEGGREVHLVRFLSKGRERWFIAFPMPNAKMLAAYEAHLKEKAEQEGSAEGGEEAAAGEPTPQAAPVSSKGDGKATPLLSEGGKNTILAEAAPVLSDAATDRPAGAAK